MLERDGVVALEAFAPPETIDTVQSELAALDEFAYHGEPGSFAGANTARNGAYLVGACPSTHQLALDPLLTAVAETLLAPYAWRLALAVASEIRVEGNSAAQVLHRDDEEWPLELVARKRPGAEIQLECMWALSDFTVEGQAPPSCPWPLFVFPPPASLGRGRVADA